MTTEADMAASVSAGIPSVTEYLSGDHRRLEPSSHGHGAPLRLRNEVQLGFKQVKWLSGMESIADYAEVGGGYGGYDEDHEFFGCRQSI